MGMQKSDKTIVSRLEQVIGQRLGARTRYDEDGQLITLDLSKLGLTQIPVELGQLTNLQRLNLSFNKLTQVPVELCQLTKLQTLDLSNNQLTQVPVELSQLTKLQTLRLGDNKLTQVPVELCQLTNLKELFLYSNQLPQVPAELGQLSNLQTLSLYGNQLTQVPAELGQLSNLQTLSLYSNRLTRVPVELYQLTNLKELILSSNRLTRVPVELAQLTNLKKLLLYNNQLTQVPVELAQLTNLQMLYLHSNQLTQMPVELCQLTKLQTLDLSDNQLIQVPAELGQLTKLQTFYLSDNQLTQVPVELSQLTNLQTLDLSNNQLTQVPAELSQLTKLQTLYLQDNPLLTPPPEIIAQGTQAILAFLRELQQQSVQRYETKLILVGEGGTGKSSLLRSLRGEPFNATLDTTHGIEVNTLTLPYPGKADQTLVLNTWDFGGQHVYHATHQFFLTRRSLYLVVWNARLGVEQGRLHYWLDTIKALAPDCPVLLVATHTDERAPDLNYQLYKDAYPQLVGAVSVSNKERKEIEALKTTLAEHAAAIPLVGQPWPTSWVGAEMALLSRKEHHISAERYRRICAVRRIQARFAQGTLGSYLHDLGKILYFREDYELCNLVVLKPNWITKAISLVLEDERVREARGILAHTELPRIWSVDEMGKPYEPHLYPLFLRLMEKFDLSYQIGADIPGQRVTHSLVPQLLPYQPPADLPDWPERPLQGQTHLQMVYHFDFVPAGIMSWFIVRTHRYTLDKHWREGVLLAYQQHYARVELNPMLREIRLVVWGIQPHNFFTVLKDTLDLILSRFAGLRIRREVPCICHWETKAAKPCQEVYRYEEDLIRRMQAGRQTIQCRDSDVDVSILKLLFGIHTSTTPQVVAVVEAGQQKILQMLSSMQQQDMVLVQQVRQLCEWNVRHFTRQWNLEMRKMDSECPNTFILLPRSRAFVDPKKWISQSYRLHLLCQYPSGPHRLDEQYGYDLDQPKEWWVNVSPWLRYIIAFLKQGVPLAGAVIDAVDFKNFEAEVDLLEKVTEDLSHIVESDPRSFEHTRAYDGQEEAMIGPALRALYSFLKEKDKAQFWGGLQKVITPDGNILWLCEKHARPYESPVLQIDG